MTVNEVRESELIKNFITMMTAIAKIELGTDFQSIEADDEGVPVGIIDYEDDKTIHYVFGKASGSQERVGRGTVHLLDKDGNPLRQQRWYDYYLSRYNEEIQNEVFEALFYFVQITSWPNLYKVFETITLDINKSENRAIMKIENDGWVEKGKLKTFSHCAQYYDAAVGAKNAYTGRSASRHSIAESRRKHKKRPYTGSIMRLPDAEDLIGLLLKGWLKSKQT